MADLEAFAAKLLKDISALPEEGMRMALLCKALSSLDPEDSAALLDIIYRTAPEYRPGQIVRSLMVDNDGVHKGLGDAAYNSIYLASIRLNLSRISRLFTEFEPHREGPSGYDVEEFIKTESLTLGERRSLSKSPLKKNIDMLLSDPDTAVIGNLLNNPRVTEREVLKIASKRPNSPMILKLVALHPKWSKRYAVTRALALNPYTQPRISIAFLEKLLVQDLEEITSDRTVHPDVAQAAKDIIEDRKGKGRG